MEFKNIETDELSIVLALAMPMAAYLSMQYKHWFFNILNIIAMPIIFLRYFPNRNTYRLDCCDVGDFLLAICQA
jgi:hypothetical protein